MHAVLNSECSGIESHVGSFGMPSPTQVSTHPLPPPRPSLRHLPLPKHRMHTYNTGVTASLPESTLLRQSQSKPCGPGGRALAAITPSPKRRASPPDADGSWTPGCRLTRRPLRLPAARGESHPLWPSPKPPCSRKVKKREGWERWGQVAQRGKAKLGEAM